MFDSMFFLCFWLLLLFIIKLDTYFKSLFSWYITNWLNHLVNIDCLEDLRHGLRGDVVRLEVYLLHGFVGLQGRGQKSNARVRQAWKQGYTQYT